MEITNSCSESIVTSVSQQHTKPSTNPTESPVHPQSSRQTTTTSVSSVNANFSDLKYLHKKFKRIASATLCNDSGSESNQGTSAAPANRITATTPVVAASSIIGSHDLSGAEPFQQQQQRLQQNQTTAAACAKEADLVNSYDPTVVCMRAERPIQTNENYGRLQLTSLTTNELHSNGASLSCANNISGSNSFISYTPREGEESKPYFPSVNNNSAINISCDLNETNQCTLISSSSSGSSNNCVLSVAAATAAATATVAESIQASSCAYESSSPTASAGHLNYGAQYDNLPLGGGSTSLINATTTATPGRYVCPFCQMNCSKPSVLQKHIRRHTNERPFRCDPCGIAFKTKSNLYKHCRSRAHASKSRGEDIGPQLDEDGSFGGSDIDDKDLSNSGSEMINRGSPLEDRVNSPQLLVEKPYKPKFHNAALYTKFDAKLANKFPVSTANISGVASLNSAPTTPHYLNGQNVESLEQHISKLISDNEAIVEVVEPPLQKKYHKITGITRGISVSSSSSSPHVGQELSAAGSSSSSNSSKLASALMQKRNSEEYQLRAQTPQPNASVLPSEANVISVSSKSSKIIVANVQQNQVPYMQNQLVMKPFPSAAEPLLQTHYLPLNLSKPDLSEPAEFERHRKRSNESLYSQELTSSSMDQYQTPPQTAQPQQQVSPQVQQQLVQPLPLISSTNPTPQSQQPQHTLPSVAVSKHPQNPERSIIKDLLLNSRGFGVVQNPENENIENLFTCKSCNISFRDAEILKYHTICYCQGNSSNLNSPSSAPISPVGSPSSHFMRSRSASDRYNPTSLKHLARVSLNPPPKNPSTLSKLAKSQLKLPKARPDNISMPPKENSSSSTMSTASGSSMLLQTAEGSQLSCAPAVVRIIDVVQNPLPSPGPLLGNTRLVDFQSNTSENYSRPNTAEPDVVVSHVTSNENPPMRKRSIIMTDNHSVDSSVSARHSQHRTLQMFGGNMEVVDRNEVMNHRYTSGGSFTQFSPDEDSEMREMAGIGNRNTMHSGGSFQQISKSNHNISPLPVNPATPKLVVTITPTLTPALTTSNFFSNHQHSLSGNSNNEQQPITHFHFPPIHPINAYNPLTLPQVSPGQASQIMHAGKLIPFVQGIPGPNTIVVPNGMQPRSSPRIAASPSQILQSISLPSGNHIGAAVKMQSASLLSVVKPVSVISSLDQRSESEDGYRSKKAFIVVPPGKNGLTKEIWSPAKQEPFSVVPKKSFNFTRIADNISPRKKENIVDPAKKEEIRYFNFENLISKSEILIKTPSTPECKPEPMDTKPLEGGQPQPISMKAKFLRPNSLPLKPGTFTPKKHHGITPTHNTMPLISPETPRQSKSCRELYFNGHAYTNIGLKSSTKPFYCTVNKTQPFYVQTQKQLSMYSNWQVHPENDPHPLGLKPITVMSLYDSSQQRDHRYSIAAAQHLSLKVVNSSSSSSAIMTTGEVKSNFPTFSVPPTHSPGSNSSSVQHILKQAPLSSTQGYITFGYHDKCASNDSMPPRSESTERTLSGGFESTEEYTYVRGRGRGKYVCKECGIRCKKPSMLKKHIRTHTDVRPYSCQHCSFHFKTKGNLTKHMKSKSHFKKCTELGLNPIPTSVDDDGGDIDIEGDQQSISSERTSTIPGDSDTGSDSEGEDSDDSDESKSRLPEHEAAHCLLSLSMTPPTGSQMPKSSYPSPVAAYGGNHQFERVGPLSYGSNPSISPGPPAMMQQPKQQHQLVQPPMDATAASQPNRRIITFGNTPKVEFNLLKHEQYYSDPNLSKKKRELSHSSPYDDDGAMPIDLTKKPKDFSLEEPIYHQLTKSSNVIMQPHQLQQQHAVAEFSPSSNRSQVIVRVSDVVTPITGTANLLTTLVSNTDKIPLANNLITNGKELADDNVYFQEYIKQRALQDSKMKQSQMKSINNNNQYESGVVTLPNAPIMGSLGSVQVELAPSGKSNDHPIPIVTASSKVLQEKTYRIFNGKNELYPKTAVVVEPVEILPVVKELPNAAKPSVYPPQEIAAAAAAESSVTEIPEPNASRMDTLAEVAAGSLKLDAVGPVRSRSNSRSSEQLKPTIIAVVGKESAKSVASEYLKLTKSVTLRKREDSESGTASDQEPLVENKLIPTPIVAPIVAPVVLVPPTTNTATPGGELGAIVARTVVVGEDGFKTTPSNEFSLSHFQEDGGRPVCEVCHKKFHKISQLKIHMNIHYMERKFRCEPCGTSFRSQGLFQKHERSATHRNKVSMTTTFGIATDSNPRPFYCRDCDVGFRIHGHLAKHLRSKMHVLKLECLGKLPFGTYTEIERSGTNLTEIDTTDCENSLSSLKRLAVRLNVKDPANVLPLGSSGCVTSSEAPLGGNETDSCDDNQFENDNESTVDDSPSSNGPSNREDGDEDNEGGGDLGGNIHHSSSSTTESSASTEPPPQTANNNNNNNNPNTMKRKPDDSSTTTTTTSNDCGGGEAKRPRFPAAPESAIINSSSAQANFVAAAEASAVGEA
ncbi:uncharacterized protein LOC129781714 [Toxorhynchites rutilus septentrionalis]|uniref:uncharacterized protein LOC129781714 n=1 Tax=Toxorhynchites rutilus septentrionalis TaxID=329112 RepID=UPI00247A2236|nr:uncharacterized protein LOC129781714 [Toxorhynchites rutilus septentrionalis]XP_055645260.1 uncharacterized protein LOC129781714 [Toxorhynchites rutilus septentrionalis]XP_055645261.1 uncharacterized protein LOC129781714 [Toxorhynchites rutilus septentrionalis]XP_055645262.1 uncharacterized protein LOC129781714 [Toxorhynchites rutilus septentrionalis]